MYDLLGLFTLVRDALETRPRITLAELSALLKVHRHTIEKAVRAASGKSFRQVQQSVIVEKAMAILSSSPDLSIKQIAVLMGYESSRGFSRAMRNALGASPKSFRRKPRVERKGRPGRA